MANKPDTLAYGAFAVAEDGTLYVGNNTSVAVETAKQTALASLAANAVRKDAQTLTTAQQTQARTNIAAAAKADLTPQLFSNPGYGTTNVGAIAANFTKIGNLVIAVFSVNVLYYGDDYQLFEINNTSLLPPSGESPNVTAISVNSKIAASFSIKNGFLRIHQRTAETNDWFAFEIVYTV